jgi:hypothetical protein
MNAPREKTSVSEDFIGVIPWDGRDLNERDIEIHNDLGISWYRRTFRWSGIEPEKGSFHFSNYDQYLEIGVAGGKKQLGILAYDASWLEHSKPDSISAADLPLYLEFARRTVANYKGMVDAWEIWNEPNLSRFWKGTDEEFCNLVKEAARIIRETDPNTIIVASGFARAPRGLINKMFKSGAFDNVDVISFHPYALNPKGTVSLLAKLKTITEKNAFTGGIWVTEIGYPNYGYNPTKVSLKKYPAHIIKTIAGLASYGAEKIFWYELYDEYNKGEEASRWDSEDFFGLIYPDYSYKEGAHAFALASNYLAGTTYLPDFLQKYDIGGSVSSFCFQRTDGESVLILWKEGIGKVTTKLTLPGVSQVSHNISTRETSALREQSDITINATPLFITWISSGEFPSLRAVK